MKRVFAALIALSVCACPVPEPEGDAGTLPDGGPCPKALVLGTEVDGGFVALTDGAPLKINAGPQGGWHVWVSTEATALSHSGSLSYVLRSSSMVVSAPLRLELDNIVIEDITCGWSRRSDALVFNQMGEPFRGMSGELEVTFESPGSAPTTVKRTVSLF
jgi:hypothetical protein